MNAYALLDQLFDLENQCLTPAAAERLAALKEDTATLVCTAELAEKANQGTLTETERREYEARVRAGAVFSLLQAKARLFLKSQTAAA